MSKYIIQQKSTIFPFFRDFGNESFTDINEARKERDKLTEISIKEYNSMYDYIIIKRTENIDIVI
jgi:hypothetical protein